MSDDFEKAVLFSFDQSGGVEPALRAQAEVYLSQLKASPDCWRLCLARFDASPFVEVRFWCLQALHEVVRTRYANLDAPARAALKQSLLAAGAKPGSAGRPGGGSGAAADGTPPLPPFLRNKIAQTLVAVAGQEYPGAWPSFFQDLLATLASGPAAVDLFCRRAPQEWLGGWVGWGGVGCGEGRELACPRTRSRSFGADACQPPRPPPFHPVAPSAGCCRRWTRTL